ncbi:hypothetical protein WOLCODRAFT_166322 [Wolfiporia cocos MD-104 SS10]|uniref:F-box domain-containing protein n=1 Tax=Wolfiporia cocos (strain MD-104) TaxID=742152 RepID=A0A2H3JCZ0_WOLCO|nr:hypothetical protein WOLCODRAFT_166322 [Wolfiporia cocos MD-104 SS10]
MRVESTTFITQPFWKGLSRKAIALRVKVRINFAWMYKSPSSNQPPSNQPSWYIGEFVYCETPSGPEVSRLPTEIWEYIIDLLHNEPQALATGRRYYEIGMKSFASRSFGALGSSEARKRCEFAAAAPEQVVS